MEISGEICQRKDPKSEYPLPPSFKYPDEKKK
jgi:hypothetical protein